MKATDSVTGQILAEAVGQQMGGNAIQTAATWQWGDAERVMNMWSEELAQKLNQLRTTGTLSAPASS
jgi:predicted carbohydrate-binding protein with CBM5 and CBM33 domain